MAKVYHGWGKKGKGWLNPLLDLIDVDDYCMSLTHHVFCKYKDTKKTRLEIWRVLQEVLERNSNKRAI